MSKTQRRTETLFRIGLWFLAFFFTSFLLGLGSQILQDLPKVESRLELDNFIDNQAKQRLESAIQEATDAKSKALEDEQRLRLDLEEAQNKVIAAQQAYDNFLTTKGRPNAGEVDQDAVTLLAHVENLRRISSIVQSSVSTAEKASFEANNRLNKAQGALADLRVDAQSEYLRATAGQEFRVFLYRLALVLPLVGIAFWLFKKKRQGRYWPFVWGFIGFAGVTFFSEVVPYLPDYGGYVHTLLAIGILVSIGHYATGALNRYAERQKALEQQPEESRRQQIGREKALVNLGKGVCPGCDRPVNLKDETRDYCEHCGLGLFTGCTSCQSRKSTFAKYCQSCGVQA